MKKLIYNKVLFSALSLDIFSCSGIVTFINPFTYLAYRRKVHLLADFDYLYVDGISLVCLIRLFYSLKIERLSFDMTGLAPKLFSYASNYGKTIYLIGDSESAIQNAVKVIHKHYVMLNIIGYRNGFFNNEQEREAVIESLIILNPDYIVVGMGLFRQEEFLAQLKKKGWSGLGFTCGGFFHQISDNIYYYPSLVNRLNLRWVYRLVKEPNVRYRIFKIIFVFPYLFIWDKIKKNR